MSKIWKCPNCTRTHESKDDTKFSICCGCLSEMKEVRYDTKKELNEVENGKQN